MIILASALTILLGILIANRKAGEARLIKANYDAVHCKHGLSKFGKCRPCREEEFGAEDANDPEIAGIMEEMISTGDHLDRQIKICTPAKHVPHKPYLYKEQHDSRNIRCDSKGPTVVVMAHENECIKLISGRVVNHSSDGRWSYVDFPTVGVNFSLKPGDSSTFLQALLPVTLKPEEPLTIQARGDEVEHVTVNVCYQYIPSYEENPPKDETVYRTPSDISGPPQRGHFFEKFPDSMTLLDYAKKQHRKLGEIRKLLLAWKPEPRFKIGDQVRVTEKGPLYRDHDLIIVRILDEGELGFYYVMRCANNAIQNWTYPENIIEMFPQGKA